MTFFRFAISSVKRSRGQQATGTAAYCAGETIRDERTGKVHNHAQRGDVRHTEILLPSRFGDAPMEWARNRTSLWNTAEEAEKRRNSRVAREYQLSLPAELNPEQRLVLARTFARELADRYTVAVDLAIHDPKPDRDTSNFHAHLVTTTREVIPTGLGAKTGLDLGVVSRAKQGLAPHGVEFSTLRERWATLTNEALQAANIATRVDHRSLAAQGIARPPVLHIPYEFYRLERQGMPKEAAERLRAEYRARVTAYRERSAGATLAEPAAAQPAAAVERTIPQRTSPSLQAEPVASRTAEAVAPAGPNERARTIPKKGLTRPTTKDLAPPTSKGLTPPTSKNLAPPTPKALTRPTSKDVAPPTSKALTPPTSKDIAPPTSKAPTPSTSRDPTPLTPKEPTPPTPKDIPPRNPEEIRRRAVQAWLQMRSKEAESNPTKGNSNEVSIQRGREESQER